MDSGLSPYSCPTMNKIFVQQRTWEGGEMWQENAMVFAQETYLDGCRIKRLCRQRIQVTFFWASNALSGCPFVRGSMAFDGWTPSITRDRPQQAIMVTCPSQGLYCECFCWLISPLGIFLCKSTANPLYIWTKNVFWPINEWVKNYLKVNLSLRTYVSDNYLADH